MTIQTGIISIPREQRQAIYKEEKKKERVSNLAFYCKGPKLQEKGGGF